MAASEMAQQRRTALFHSLRYPMHIFGYTDVNLPLKMKICFGEQGGGQSDYL